MKYRPEIDGLRAIAVLPVILFHAGFTIFSGGFVGVDVFFVLSGFLITSIILQEKEAGTFTIANFYKRRARRVLPALFLVIFACLPFAWLWMLPSQMEDFANSILMVLIFGSNFHFWKSSGYFAEAADEKPLLHTWSLAVEEQYYLFFPLLIIALWRNKKQTIPYVIAAGLLISFTLCEVISRIYPDANFYLAHTRIWELFAGSLVALIPARSKNNNLFSLLGLGFIIASIFVFDSSLRWPSAYTIVPILGTALVLLYATPKTIAYKILSKKIFIGIGLISYSAYLWHQPLFAFARIKSAYEPSSLLMTGLAVLSLLLAYLSWKFVETPFRRQQVTIVKPRNALIFCTLSLATLAAIAYYEKGIESRFDPEVRKILAARHDYTPPQKKCNFSPKKQDKAEDCWLNSSPNKSVLLLGDSHANGLAFELSKSLEKLDINLKRYTKDSCAPIPNLVKLGASTSDKCFVYNEHVKNALESTDMYKIIVLHARWVIRAEGTRFDNHEGGVDEVIFNQHDVLGEPKFADRKTRVLEAYKDYVKTLLSQGKQVVLVYPVPETGWDVPDHAAKIMLHSKKRPEVSTSYEIFKERNRDTILAFDSIQHPNLYRFYPSDYLCNKTTNRCINVDSNNVYYKDDDHLSNVGVRLFADDLAHLIESVNRKIRNN